MTNNQNLSQTYNKLGNPVKSKLPVIPRERFKRLNHHGEWAIDEMNIRVINLKRAIIYYEKYVVNAYRYEKFVDLHWWERRQGKTLSEKVQEVYDQLKVRLEKENEEIREMKRIEKGIIR